MEDGDIRVVDGTDDVAELAKVDEVVLLAIALREVVDEGNVEVVLDEVVVELVKVEVEEVVDGTIVVVVVLEEVLGSGKNVV